MTVTKSRKFNVDGVSYVATFDKDKNLNGISKTRGRAGQTRETPINPSSSEFANVLASDEALNAYNVNRFKGKGESGQITKASVEELNKVYDQNTKKNNNQNIFKEISY